MPRSKKIYFLIGVTLVLIIAAVVARTIIDDDPDSLRFEREETEIVISNPSGSPLSLFKSGASMDEDERIDSFDGKRIWLPNGNYFLRVDQEERTIFYPVSVIAYRGGPDEDGSLGVTVRRTPSQTPPRLFDHLPEFVYIPSGHFLIGDRLNLREPHYVWIGAFYIAPFEVTNEEFGLFLDEGYADDSHWTDEGKRWRSKNASQASAVLKAADADRARFGQPDQPVTQVSWFEAAAFCRWMTKMKGGGRWIYALPSEAEWEKAARGPQSFDYGLGMKISDAEVSSYNWKKNPDAAVTVIGWRETRKKYEPNLYGLYHTSGNVAEWTETINRPYNRERPYRDDDRNHESAAGLRVVRGGSWYSASIALLYLAYRDAFQAEHRSNERGFRIVARPVP
jgi:formylglycine-generating enzyme required for sulfatase activity